MKNQKVPKKSKRQRKAGLAPGSIVFTGRQKVDEVFVHYLLYDAEKHVEKTLETDQRKPFPSAADTTQVDWYDIRGLHDIEFIKSLGEAFQVHTLILEDIADIHQRPKLEEYANGIFIIIKALSFSKTDLKVKTEQVAIFFRAGILLSFQEAETDLFGAVRQRIANPLTKIRQRNTDYLAYALLDNIVDNYFFILENIEEEIDRLENQLLNQPDHSIKEQIHHLKKELLVVRKAIAPLREAINRFAKSDVDFINENSAIYIRDLYDHTIQIMDMVETYRDLLNGLQDLYISEISLKMNQVMQVLTIITTIFVPLSFLAGLYGMNFENMPELHFKYGYYVLLSVMFFIFILSLVYFRRKKWF